MNQPLSVQPWGSDGDKRRYYLIEGLDDTHFRVYRESNHTGIKRTWWSVAGSIEELTALAEKLEKEDRGQKARLLSGKMMAAVPRFEATEEVRYRDCWLDIMSKFSPRSASVASIGKLASNSSSALNPISRCMKAEQEASV